MAYRDINKKRAYRRAWGLTHKDLMKSYRDKWRVTHEKEIRAYGVKRNRQLKHDVLAAYGGALCVCCGEKNEAFLTLDHKNNDGAAHRLRIAKLAGYAFYSYLRAHKFPQDPVLQVLCWNCNCGKNANGGVCPHDIGR